MVYATRQYYKRIDPFTYYTDTKFLQRYRLTKPVVRLLIIKFVASLEKKVLRGKHAVPHRLRVSVHVDPSATPLF